MGGRVLTVRVDDDMYRVLEDVARRKGVSVSWVVREAVRRYARGLGFEAGVDVTGEVLNIKKAVGELSERVTNLEITLASIMDRLGGVDKVREVEERLEKLESMISEGRDVQEREGKGKRRKRSVKDVLKDIRVQFLSEFKPRNPEAFIKKARDEGLVVIEGDNDVAIVYPDFYREVAEWLNKQSESTLSPDTPEKRKLVNFLLENGLIYYSHPEKKWKWTEKQQ